MLDYITTTQELIDRIPRSAARLSIDKLPPVNNELEARKKLLVEVLTALKDSNSYRREIGVECHHHVFFEDHDFGNPYTNADFPIQDWVRVQLVLKGYTAEIYHTTWSDTSSIFDQHYERNYYLRVSI